MAYSYTQNYVEIDEILYKSSRYISRCRVLDYNRNRLTVILSSREYQEALYLEQQEKLMYGNQQYALGWQGASSCSPSVQTYGTEPIKKDKEIKKASKQIRHQFLKKRLLERLTK